MAPTLPYTISQTRVAILELLRDGQKYTLHTLRITLKPMIDTDPFTIMEILDYMVKEKLLEKETEISGVGQVQFYYKATSTT